MAIQKLTKVDNCDMIKTHGQFYV